VLSGPQLSLFARFDDVTAGNMTVIYGSLFTLAVAGQQLHGSVSTGNTLYVFTDYRGGSEDTPTVQKYTLQFTIIRSSGNYRLEQKRVTVSQNGAVTL